MGGPDTGGPMLGGPAGGGGPVGGPAAGGPLVFLCIGFGWETFEIIEPTN